MQISTVAIANVDVICSSSDNSHGEETLHLNQPQDSSIAGEEHMASLRFAVCAVIGPITIWVLYETMANGYAIAFEV
jgi:hypothetical protein